MHFSQLEIIFPTWKLFFLTFLANSPEKFVGTEKFPEGGFHFISEMFFSTYYSIHVGIIPAISQYTTFIELYSQTNGQLNSMKKAFGDGKLHKNSTWKNYNN